MSQPSFGHAPPPLDGQQPIRRRVRSAIRIATVLWALLALAVTGGVLTGYISEGDGIGEIIFSTLFFLVLSIGPAAAHIWWSRNHPLEGQTPAVAPMIRVGLLGRLDQIREATDDLHDRGWLSSIDRSSIQARVQRFDELAITEHGAVGYGGAPSPVLAREVDMLGQRVFGLLDAAIASSAVEPGDADLDARLQAQLDALNARSQALSEVEGRTQPGH